MFSPSSGCDFRSNKLTLYLLHRVATRILIALPVYLSLQAENKAFSAGESCVPNIVLILVDDMGYGDPGCYNAESKIPTPNIDSLARDGMRFTDAHAAGPLCHVSRYGLLTGRYPFRTNVGVWRQNPVITEDRVTIASLLKSQGYHTAMVGKWHLGFKELGYDKPLAGGPVDRGFESFFGIRASTDIPPYFYIRNNRAVAPPTNTTEAKNSEGWSPIQGAFSRAGGIAPDLKLKDVLPRFTDEAIKVIEEHATSSKDREKAQPLMLYLAYPAPHTPWLPSREFIGRSGASMYGDFTMMVDAMIGRVLKSLDNQGMKDNTLVIFSSDNGPVWYESNTKRFGHNSTGGLRGIKGGVWEGGHRMPFLARWPNRIKAGSVSHQTICFTDMLATFAGIVGTKLPDGAGPDGVDVSPVLFGTQPEDKPIRDALVIRAGRKHTMIRMGDWKLIDGAGSGGFSDRKRPKPGQDRLPGQLYNLRDDLSETKNLYADKPEIVARLKKKLEEIRNE